MPRCVRCGPQLQGCAKCHCKDLHKHVVLEDRAGNVIGDVALCAACLAHMEVRGRRLLDLLDSEKTVRRSW